MNSSSGRSIRLLRISNTFAFFSCVNIIVGTIEWPRFLPTEAPLKHRRLLIQIDIILYDINWYRIIINYYNLYNINIIICYRNIMLKRFCRMLQLLVTFSLEIIGKPRMLHVVGGYAELEVPISGIIIFSCRYNII